VTYERQQNGQQVTLVEKQKGGKLRLETQAATESTGPLGNDVAVVFDNSAGTMTMIMPSKKGYMTIPTPQGSAGAGVDSAKLSFTPTSRTKVVAGAQCQVYKVTTSAKGESQQSEACVADGVGFTPFDMGSVMAAAAGAGGLLGGMNDLLKGGKGLLEVVTYAGGQPTIGFHAVKIDRTPPSDAEFAPPADYKVLSMSDLSAMMPKQP
jgi:hypothetical protein